MPDASEATFWRKRIVKVGGPVIFTWKVLGLLATMVLLVLVVYTTVQEGWPTFGVVKITALVRRIEYLRIENY